MTPDTTTPATPSTTASSTPGTGPIPLDEPLMTPDEVAAILRLAPLTVSRMARAGRIRAVRTAAGYRFQRAAIADYITANTTGEQVA